MLIDIFSDRYEHAGTAEKKDAHAAGPVAPHLLRPARQPRRQDRAAAEEGTRPGRVRPPRLRRLHRRRPLPRRRGHPRRRSAKPTRNSACTTSTYADFVPLGIRQTAVTLAPDRIEREFQHWHLLPYDSPLDSIPLDDAEVSGLVEVSLDDAIALAAGDRQQADALYLTRDGHARHASPPGTLTTADLIPGYLAIDRLYLRLFIAARRYLRGDREYLSW